MPMITSFGQQILISFGTLNLAASVSLARWDGEDGPLYSIGMFYCVQKYRGQGLGKPIFKQIMDIVGNDNAVLAGALKMWEKYVKDFGFDKVPEHLHMMSVIKIDDIITLDMTSDKFYTKSWSDVDYDSLTAYDKTICIRDRKRIMKSWFEISNTITRVVLDKSEKIVGYGTIRLVSKGKLQFAPFYADNSEAAEILMTDLFKSFPNVEKYACVMTMYPAINGNVLPLFEKFAKSKDLVSTFPIFKMQFTKKYIDSPDQKVYGLSDCNHQFV